MARGGYRVGGGRPRKDGSAPVEKSFDEKPKPEKECPVLPGESKTPLEYMLRVMNDPNVDDGRRDRMAIAAAPFVHGKAGDLGKKQEKNKAAEKVGVGKFGASAPPRLVVDNTPRVN